MDLSKLSSGDKFVAGGAVAFLVAMFLPWFSFDTKIIDVSANGWDYGFSGIVSLLILAAAAALVLAPAAGKAIKAPAITVLALCALAALMVVFRFLVGQDGLSRSFGLFVALVGALAATYGGFAKFKAAGGTIQDLKDPNKLKGQMQAGFQTLASDLKDTGKDTTTATATDPGTAPKTDGEA